MGTLGSVAGGVIGGIYGGPAGAAAGSALGGAAGGALDGKSTEEIAGKAATSYAMSGALGGAIGEGGVGALDAATDQGSNSALDNMMTSGEITDMSGGAAQVQQAPLASPFGADPLRGYGQDQLPDYMQANQGRAMYANTGGPVPNANGTPSNSKFNYSNTDMNTPNQLVEGFQYGPLASVEYKKTGGKVGESYKMSYHNPLSATKQSKE